jgi:hypothetical protein
MLKIFEQCTRLFILEFPRKKFECVSSKDKLFAMNTSKNTFIALLFTFFSCGLLFSFIEALVNKSPITTEVVVSSVILFMVGLLGLRQFLWLINGRQELIIENGTLILTKKGTFLTGSKTYSFEKVTNVREAIYLTNLSLYDQIQRNMSLTGNVLLWQTVGQIVFDYNGLTISLFNDMDSNERKELITEINKLKK